MNIDTNPDLEEFRGETLNKITRYERYWSIVKITLALISVTILIIINFYTYHHLLNNSNTNRNLLRCAVSAFNTQDATMVHSLVNKCLEADK